MYDMHIGLGQNNLLLGGKEDDEDQENLLHPDYVKARSNLGHLSDYRPDKS